MTVIVLGKPVVGRGSIRVLAIEKFKIPPLESKKSKEVKMKSFEVKYDDDNSVRDGDKYSGYAIFVHNQDDILIREFVPSSIEKQYGNKLLKAKTGELLEAN